VSTLRRRRDSGLRSSARATSRRVLRVPTARAVLQQALCDRHLGRRGDAIFAVRVADPSTPWTSRRRRPSRRRGRGPRPQRRRRAMVRAERTASAPAPFNGPSTASRFAALLRAN
jgi:hypothetical protein